MTLIKYYPNRKLYDTSRHIYITLKDILYLMYNEGERFKVIDIKSKKNITALTLTKALFEHQIEYNDFKETKDLEDVIDAMHNLRSLT